MTRNPRTIRPRLIYGNVTRIVFPSGHYDLLRKPKMYGLPGGELWITWGNPSHYPREPRDVVVTRRYGKVIEIQAQKTNRHACDAKCKEGEHKYYHPFDYPNEMFQLQDGSLLVMSR